ESIASKCADSAVQRTELLTCPTSGFEACRFQRASKKERARGAFYRRLLVDISDRISAQRRISGAGACGPGSSSTGVSMWVNHRQSPPTELFQRHASRFGIDSAVPLAAWSAYGKKIFLPASRNGRFHRERRRRSVYLVPNLPQGCRQDPNFIPGDGKNRRGRNQGGRPEGLLLHSRPHLFCAGGGHTAHHQFRQPGGVRRAEEGEPPRSRIGHRFFLQCKAACTRASPLLAGGGVIAERGQLFQAAAFEDGLEFAQQAGVNAAVGGEHFVAGNLEGAAAEIAERPARFANQHCAAGGVPGIEVEFPEAIEAAGSDRGEVERRRSRTPHAVGPQRD